MSTAPIALFVYNRLSHTRRTLEALRRNVLAADSELTIFADGPKKEGDWEKVEAVRSYLKSVNGFKMVTLVERNANMGLARSVISGVTDTVNRHGKVIVLEDDMVTSPFFLQYMNGALDLYQNEEQVISVVAYIYPVATPLPATFFLPGADCWGWATWKRGWDLFEPDGQKLLGELEAKGLTRRFDMDGSYGYTRMLKKQIAGENDSWAIRWYASAFLKDRLSLYPGISLVDNIGNDGEGTHSRKTNAFHVETASRPVVLAAQAPVPDEAAAKAVQRYFRSTRNTLPALLKRVLGKVLSRS